MLPVSRPLCSKAVPGNNGVHFPARVLATKPLVSAACFNMRNVPFLCLETCMWRVRQVVTSQSSKTQLFLRASLLRRFFNGA